MKRIISFLLSFVFMLLMMPSSAYAQQISSEVISFDDNLELQSYIDSLYVKRNELALDFDRNKEQIDQIDQELASLGVEEISYAELANKLGSTVSPQYTVNQPDSYTTWTSRRYSYNYQGNLYEIQVITGVPNSTSSKLSRIAEFHSNPSYGITVGSINALKVVAGSVIGNLGNVGQGLGVAITLYDAAKAYVSGLQKTTVFEDVYATYKANISANMRYVFVKTYGSADSGNQILCYVGNYATYITSIDIDDQIYIDGNLTPVHIDHSHSGSIQSTHYDNYSSIASSRYLRHKQGDSDWYEYNYVASITMTTLTGDINVALPIEYI